jgi:hypothetical protein
MDHPCVYSGFNWVDLSLINYEDNVLQDIVDFLISMVMETNDFVTYIKEEANTDAETSI